MYLQTVGRVVLLSLLVNSLSIKIGCHLQVRANWEEKVQLLPVLAVLPASSRNWVDSVDANAESPALWPRGQGPKVWALRKSAGLATDYPHVIKQFDQRKHGMENVAFSCIVYDIGFRWITSELLIVLMYKRESYTWWSLFFPTLRVYESSLQGP